MIFRLVDLMHLTEKIIEDLPVSQIKTPEQLCNILVEIKDYSFDEESGISCFDGGVFIPSK